MESLHRDKDGAVFPVEIEANYIEFGGTPYDCAFVRDISGRKRAEREREDLIARLEAQNAELERFAYTVSHDLKTPLITIKGYLGLLEKDMLGNDPQQVADDMARIGGAADKMTNCSATCSNYRGSAAGSIRRKTWNCRIGRGGPGTRRGKNRRRGASRWTSPPICRRSTAIACGCARCCRT